MCALTGLEPSGGDCRFPHPMSHPGLTEQTLPGLELQLEFPSAYPPGQRLAPARGANSRPPGPHVEGAAFVRPMRDTR